MTTVVDSVLHWLHWIVSGLNVVFHAPALWEKLKGLWERYIKPHPRWSAVLGSLVITSITTMGTLVGSSPERVQWLPLQDGKFEHALGAFWNFIPGGADPRKCWVDQGQLSLATGRQGGGVEQEINVEIPAGSSVVIEFLIDVPFPPSLDDKLPEAELIGYPSAGTPWNCTNHNSSEVLRQTDGFERRRVEFANLPHATRIKLQLHCCNGLGIRPGRRIVKYSDVRIGLIK